MQQGPAASSTGRLGEDQLYAKRDAKVLDQLVDTFRGQEAFVTAAPIADSWLWTILTALAQVGMFGRTHSEHRRTELTALSYLIALYSYMALAQVGCCRGAFSQAGLRHGTTAGSWHCM